MSLSSGNVELKALLIVDYWFSTIEKVLWSKTFPALLSICYNKGLPFETSSKVLSL